MPHGHIFTFLRNFNREIRSIIVSFTNVYHFWESIFVADWCYFIICEKKCSRKFFFIRSAKTNVCEKHFNKLFGALDNWCTQKFLKVISCVSILLRLWVSVLVSKSVVSEDDLHGILYWLLISFFMKQKFWAKVFIWEHK